MQPLRTYIEMEYLEKKMTTNKEYFKPESYWKGLNNNMMPAV